MFEIRPKQFSNGTFYINVTGNKLLKKFSIHEGSNVYSATASLQNHELIEFLDQLDYLESKIAKSDGYYWWKIKPTKVITLLNAVMNEFSHRLFDTQCTTSI